MITPIPINILVKKTTSMVQALWCLHNWLIDIHDDSFIIIPETIPRDRYDIVVNGGGSLMNIDICNNTVEIRKCVDMSNQFDDSTRRAQCNDAQDLIAGYNCNSQEYLLAKLKYLGIKNRSKPMGTTTTNNK